MTSKFEYQQSPSDVMFRATHVEDGFPFTWESYAWLGGVLRKGHAHA